MVWNPLSFSLVIPLNFLQNKEKCRNRNETFMPIHRIYRLGNNLGKGDRVKETGSYRCP